MRHPLTFTDIVALDQAAIRVTCDADGTSATLPIHLAARRKLQKHRAITYLLQKSLQDCLGLHEIKVEFVNSSWKSMPNLTRVQSVKTTDEAVLPRVSSSPSWSRMTTYAPGPPHQVPSIHNVFITDRGRAAGPTQTNNSSSGWIRGESPDSQADSGAKAKASRSNHVALTSAGKVGTSERGSAMTPSDLPRPIHKIHERSPRSFQEASVRKYQELAGKNFYRDENCSQILDFLFIGNIETAYNEHLLCKLNIESIVDISNMEPHQIPRHRKSDCPCTCALETSHPRARLWLGVGESRNTDMLPYFEDISTFIEAARRKDKNVLVHSLEGDSRATCAIIQYMMKYHDMTLRCAFNLVKKRWPTVNMSASFQHSLEMWERKLLPGVQASMTFEEMSRQNAWN